MFSTTTKLQRVWHSGVRGILLFAVLVVMPAIIIICPISNSRAQGPPAPQDGLNKTENPSEKEVIEWDQIVRKDPKTEGVLVPWTGMTYKFGGFVKADLIHDFDAIGKTDRFDVGTIPTDGREGENTRLHGRQTRFNLDVRWPTDHQPVRVFGEVDFFGDNSTLRLRHAYGEMGPLLAGQTFSTFIDPDIIPETLDN